MSTEDQEEQSPVNEALTELRSKPSKFLETWRAFHRTKRAVMRGIPLDDWTQADLKGKGFLGPWKFNAFETGVTGGIASLTTNVANLLSEESPTATLPAEGSDPAFQRLLETTSGWVDPFAVPLLLTAVVFLMGWGTLRARDSTPASRRRSRFAYLYLDGAHGLYSQLFLAFGVSFLTSALGQRFLESESVAVILFIAGLAVALLWQIFVSLRRIPRLLFVANGYSARARHFWQRSLPNDPPWNKLVLAHTVGGWPLIIAVNVSLALTSLALAGFFFWLRKLVS